MTWQLGSKIEMSTRAGACARGRFIKKGLFGEILHASKENSKHDDSDATTNRVSKLEKKIIA